MLTADSRAFTDDGDVGTGDRPWQPAVTTTRMSALGQRIIGVAAETIVRRLVSVRHVGDHHAPQRSVRERGRVAELRFELLERSSLYGVFGTEAHVQVAD